MADSIRSTSTPAAANQVAIDGTKRAPGGSPVASPASPAVLATPDAPATSLRAAAARASAMPTVDTNATAHIGSSLTALAKGFGPAFTFTGMTESEAVAATTTSLAAVKSALGFAASAHGFAPLLAFKDALGLAHVRLGRTFHGVPIFGEQAVTHLDTSGAVRDITNNTLPASIDVDVVPTLSASAATDKARAACKPSGKLKSVSLVVAKTDDGVYHLAFYVHAGASHRFVDAHSGELLPIGFDESGYVPDFVLKASTDAPAAKTDKGSAELEEGTGNSLYNGEVKLTTTKEGGKYVLRDPSHLNSETSDAHNDASPASVVTDDDNKWGTSTDDQRVRAAVDAQWAAAHFLDYLKETFGRDSIDGKGQPLQSQVHVGQEYNNANWDGSTMNYGDGDGKLFGPLVDADVGSHEPTHGLTQHTSGLIYRQESGALNEAGSDILGSAGFSWYLHGKGDAVEADFLLGEHCFTPGQPGDALRYMADPTLDKARKRGEFYSRDNYSTRYMGFDDGGGVHLNSGIANNFFFLLCQGGVNRTSQIKVEKGIGMAKALQIYFRGHTVYFTPSTTFAQARVAMIKAATDLYGADSVEAKTVAQAWTAVGVESKSAPQALVA